MDGSLKLREEFSLYLEIAGPPGHGQSCPSGIRQADIDRIREDWRRRGILSVLETNRKQIASLLGTPDFASDDGSTLEYSLRFQPNYRYVFQFNAEGLLVDSGFTRVPPRSPPVQHLEGQARDATVTRLVEMGATASELIAWFGVPLERDAWWPLEWWTYRGGIRLTLRNRIVCVEPISLRG